MRALSRAGYSSPCEVQRECRGPEICPLDDRVRAIIRLLTIAGGGNHLA